MSGWRKYAAATFIALLLTGAGLLIKREMISSGSSCSGQLERQFFTPDGEIALSGFVTMVFGSSQSDGTLRFTGHLAFRGSERYRVNRMLTFTMQPEKTSGYYSLASRSLSKAPDDNTPEALMSHTALLSPAQTLIDARYLADNTLVIGDTFVPILFCSRQE